MEKQKEKKRKEEQKRKIASLSFSPNDGEEEDEEDNGEDEDCKLFQFFGGSTHCSGFYYSVHFYSSAVGHRDPECDHGYSSPAVL